MFTGLQQEPSGVPLPRRYLPPFDTEARSVATAPRPAPRRPCGSAPVGRSLLCETTKSCIVVNYVSETRPANGPRPMSLRCGQLELGWPNPHGLNCAANSCPLRQPAATTPLAAACSPRTTRSSPSPAGRLPRADRNSFIFDTLKKLTCRQLSTYAESCSTPLSPWRHPDFPARLTSGHTLQFHLHGKHSISLRRFSSQRHYAAHACRPKFASTRNRSYDGRDRPRKVWIGSPG